MHRYLTEILIIGVLVLAACGVGTEQMPRTPIPSPLPTGTGVSRRLADAPTSTPGGTLEGGMRVDVGGYALWIQCSGQGSRPVVLDAGFGKGASAWSKVQPGVVEFARVCAYDRAGLGSSDRGPDPTTSRQQVLDLRALLANARVAGPFVLVGHSFGGMNVELYARTYPAEAAGLVLVDAAHEDFYLDPEYRKYHSDVAAGVDLTESARQVRAAPPLPDVPLIPKVRAELVELLLDGRPIAEAGPERLLQERLARSEPGLELRLVPAEEGAR